VTALINSLIPHSKNGTLKHIEFNDNYIDSDDQRNALFNLLKEANTLEHLDIGSSNMYKENETEKAMELIEQLKESACKESLRTFNWGFDADEMNVVIEALLEVLGDRDLFPKIERVELQETLCGGKRRNELRKAFAEKDIKLVMSERQC